jgi:twitching motility protein PilU
MERDQASKFMFDLLRLMVSKGGSDLFITAGFPPAIKIDGKMTPVSNQAADRRAHGRPGARHHERQADRRLRADQGGELRDQPGDLGRFRVSAFVQMSSVGMVLRTITTRSRIRRPRLPPVLKDVIMTKRGLVIMVGATGSGKSTTLAAMVGYRNENSYGHIITIEDPVEYVHPHRNCVITQREVGVDTDSLGSGAEELAAPGAGRDPDRRDPRPRDHGPRDRLRRDRPPVPGHPARQQRQPGAGPHHQLLPGRAPPAAADGPVAEPEGLISQRLIPKKEDQGPRGGDRDHAEFAADLGPDLQGQVHEIKEIMKKSRELGMQTFDQALFDLYEADKILRGRAAQRRLGQRPAPEHQAQRQGRQEPRPLGRHRTPGHRLKDLPWYLRMNVFDFTADSPRRQAGRPEPVQAARCC